ncbi:DUF3717 domain-containing protein [Massilia soli]|uniref:DUF3717 domain-containing protein n=1 Tax=Massilia soli TaxID=2792854 RepID=A0ABS7SKA7_9BURK|nr:DUF3717 domain-containing protein [Massilia soli]MBZ2206549.1 DUF3717 domain-containing protein [Massilia soli]
MTVITIVQLESAINRARDQHPPIDCVLHWSVKMLAEVYSQMIYQKASTLELDNLPNSIRDEVFLWIPGDVEPFVAGTSQACSYRTGDPGFDSCEACQ